MMPPDLRATMRPTVAVDFDGVIHGNYQGYAAGDLYGDPIPGCRTQLAKLRALGVRIIVHSARCTHKLFRITDELGTVRTVSSPPQSTEVAAWLEKHDICYDELWDSPGKPLADFYIDDRAIRFVSWEQTFAELQASGFHERGTGRYSDSA